MAAELRTLVELSRTLGEPSRDLVILAEGNTSIRTDPDRMLVKASGAELGTAADEDFVEVDIRTMLDLVNDEQPVRTTSSGCSVTWAAGANGLRSRPCCTRSA